MKQQIWLSVLLSLACLSCLTTNLPAQPKLGEAFDRFILDAMKAAQTPGAAIAIVKDEQVLFAKGYGVTSIEFPAPITTDTLFRLGSTTKMFTAAALVQLAEEGKLKLDAPIGNYLRGLSPKLAQVTVHQLLSHTSGLRDFAATVKSNDDEALATMIRGWKDDVFFGEPGKIYSYSSPGYWLAGFVLEEITKQAYADAMKTRLFAPLGMNQTTLRPLEALTYPLAIGHKIEADKPVIIRPAFNNNAMWPAGSIYSSVNELARFAIAFLNAGRLEGQQPLLPTVITKLSAKHISMPFDAASAHGYGLMVYRFRGIPMVSHGGFSTGYGSMIYLAPEHRVAVIVLTNKSGETLQRVGQQSLSLVLPLAAADNQAVTSVPPLTETELAQVPGTYTHAPQTFKVVASNKQLALIQEKKEYTLKKIGAFAFQYGDQQEHYVVFVPNAQGHIEYSFDGMYAARKMARK